MRGHELVWVVLAVSSLTAGCSSGPSRVQPPSIDADAAGEQAVEMFDKDGDGAIAGAELDATPGIKAALEQIDANSDGKVTAEEVTARVEAWQAGGIGVMSVSCQFNLDGRPLAGAEVIFEPEPFLGDDIKAAVGETTGGGNAMPSVPKDQRATSDTPPGFQLGLYRIRVSKKANGQQTLPASLNTETTVGAQISDDDPAIRSQKVVFDLKSK